MKNYEFLALLCAIYIAPQVEKAVGISAAAFFLVGSWVAYLFRDKP
jgi:hypothetical protein